MTHHESHGWTCPICSDHHALNSEVHAFCDPQKLQGIKNQLEQFRSLKKCNIMPDVPKLSQNDIPTQEMEIRFVAKVIEIEALALGEEPRFREIREHAKLLVKLCC